MAYNTALQVLVERSRVADVINTLFLATDAREWDRVRACFASKVTLDMTSMAGGTPRQLSAREIVAGWEAGLRPIESIHHQIGNLAITPLETTATASCYGTAYHYRRNRSGRNTRMIVGSYDFNLRLVDGDWRIDLFRFKLKFLDGNVELEKEPGV